MHHGVTHSLIYQIQRLIRPHLHKTKKRKYSDKFPSRGTATVHTYKGVQSCTLQKEEHTHNRKFT